MVVAAIFEQFVPSDRGLSRDESATGVNARQLYNPSTYDTREYRNLPLASNLSSNLEASSKTSFISPQQESQQQSQQPQQPSISTPVTKRKRKRFRASKLLASVAADLDVVTDWIFYVHTLDMDREYRTEFAANPVAGANPYLIPPFLHWILLIVCVLGTTLWLVLATDGAVLAPLLRRLHVDKLSMGYTLFLCVLVEDIPQVILTCVIEDYFGEDGQINDFALVSVVASLYDTLIKLAEAFDERMDVVETGVWCKQSLWAHKKTVTAVIPLRIPDPTDDSALYDPRKSRMHVPSAQRRGKRGWTVLEEAREMVAETKLPRIRFLSTSKDKTIRLWDTCAQNSGHKRDKCTRSIRGHLKGVTCVTFLGEIQRKRLKRGGLPSTGNQEEDVESRMYFLTGSEDGKAKFWDLKGECIRNYSPMGEEKESKVTSITYINRNKTFVCGYNSGVARMWDLWSGACIAEYRGHNQEVNAVCSLEDSYSFLSASDDGTIRLWDTSTSVAQFNAAQKDTTLPSDSHKCLTLITDESICTEKVSSKTFLGHNGPVLSLACVEPGVAFLSGSQDGTARLWSLEQSNCLRIFIGHTGPVTTIAVVDPVTFLTGSKDTTIKIWDAFSAGCIRTYTGHTKGVTCVGTAENGTFISASEDRTIKLWVFTVVSPIVHAAETLHDILGTHDV
jgi:WD40 repeat protein